MQGIVESAGPLSLFRSLLRVASLLILDMGIFFPSDGCARILFLVMCLTRCGLGESHTPKFPREGINFGGAEIFL
jgi:hypothetical protein